ncbi:MAG: hypothetical protein JSR17_02340 [Proteobacteria bacterium]|nr:hypothetical protein [Pseudomonadota bacterium]
MKVLNSNEIKQVSGAGDLWKVYYQVPQSAVKETMIMAGCLSGLAALGVSAVFGKDAGMVVAGLGAAWTYAVTLDMQSKVGTNPYEL